MATREQPKRTYKLDEAVAFALEPNSDSDMSDVEDSEDDEYIPDTVEREMDDDGDDEVDENEENDLLMSDEASDDDGENNEDHECNHIKVTIFLFRLY